tara:strand:+ start:195 stop:566 length:372 start_codon:yes stop_codon:yes gene_type:complete
MKSFREFMFEQKQPPPPVKIPDSDPADMSIDPRDIEVIKAFFRGEPDVMGTKFVTKQNDDADYNVDDLRIDLLFGRGRLGVAIRNDDLITLGELDTMVDRTPDTEQLQSIIRNMAKSLDMRVM